VTSSSYVVDEVFYVVVVLSPFEKAFSVPLSRKDVYEILYSFSRKRRSIFASHWLESVGTLEYGTKNTLW